MKTNKTAEIDPGNYPVQAAPLTAMQRFENWWQTREKEPWRHVTDLKQAMSHAWLQALGEPEPEVLLDGNRWESMTGIRVIGHHDWWADTMTLAQFLNRCRQSTCEWPAGWIDRLPRF